MEPCDFLKEVWSLHARPGLYFCISTKHNGRWKDHFIEWGNEHYMRRRIREVINKRQWENVYFCPNPFKKPHRRIDHKVDNIRYLWSDLDEVAPRDCILEPSIAWRTSPGRWSGLWRLRKPTDSDSGIELNRKLTYRNGADKSGWDYTQVLRVPGTVNGKYPAKPIVKLVQFKRDLSFDVKDFRTLPEPISTDKIIANYKLPSKVKQTLNAKKVIPGTRSDTLWWLEHELAKAGMKPQEIIAVIKASAWNKYKGRRDEDERLTNEVMKILENKVDAKQVEDPREEIEGAVRKHTGTIVRLADVEPEAVSWLWYPYIPFGKLTLVEGDPGLGKSWLSFALASYLSTARTLPGQTRSERRTKRRVLLMSAEDGIADTIAPRLVTLGADRTRVFSFTEPVVFDEEGALFFEEQIAQLRPSLVILDPLVAYMGGGIDLHKANETREVLHRLVDIADRYQIAVVGIRHLTKGGRDKAIYRGLGSIDLTAAARSVLHVGQDPEDEDSRIICHIKSNLAPLGDSIRYTLSKADPKKPFRWDGTCSYKASDLVQNDKDLKPGSALETAKNFLLEALKDSDVEQFKLARDAEARGVSTRTLQRASKILNVEIRRKNGHSYWELPYDTRMSARASQAKERRSSRGNDDASLQG